ncbi:MAG TPA: hypothetical protein VMD31_02250 [Opitutaceae bacterium]|nr:hypothetical protein [Opitutaceae bacterium]
MLLLPLILAYLQWSVIPLEEMRLAEVFAGDYAHYRSRVRRWLQARCATVRRKVNRMPFPDRPTIACQLLVDTGLGPSPK